MSKCAQRMKLGKVKIFIIYKNKGKIVFVKNRKISNGKFGECWAVVGETERSQNNSKYAKKLVISILKITKK